MTSDIRPVARHSACQRRLDVHDAVDLRRIAFRTGDGLAVSNGIHEHAHSLADVALLAARR